MESFQCKQPVWNLVKEFVPDSEFPEIKAVLGDALIDMYTEIYSEMQIWEQIWREVQCSSQGREKDSPHSPLPDPPAVKDLLRAELQLLLLTLQEQAARLGRDEGEVMGRYSPRVVSYALSASGPGSTPAPSSPTSRLNHSDGTQAPSSPTSRLNHSDGTPAPSSPASRLNHSDGTPAPSSPTSRLNHSDGTPAPSSPASRLNHNESRSSSRSVSRSSCADEIKALKHKLNVSHIDEVVAHLQSVFTEECDCMKRDIQLLQESVELEYQKRADPKLVEPTLTELREERRILQRDLHTLRVTDEAARLATPRASVPPSPARELMLTAVTSDPRVNTSVSLVIPRTDCPYTKPSPPEAPGYRQSGLSTTLRHRPAFKAVHASALSLPPEQPLGLDSDHSTPDTEWHTLPLTTYGSFVRTSNHGIMLREEHTPKHPVSARESRPHPTAGSDHGQPRGSAAAGSTRHATQPGLQATQPLRLLCPTPPAVQKTASRGQRVSRRTVLPRAASLLSSELS